MAAWNAAAAVRLDDAYAAWDEALAAIDKARQADGSRGPLGTGEGKRWPRWTGNETG